MSRQPSQCCRETAPPSLTSVFQFCHSCLHDHTRRPSIERIPPLSSTLTHYSKNSKWLPVGHYVYRINPKFNGFLAAVHNLTRFRENRLKTLHYAVVTREIKLFQNYFSLRRRRPEIIHFSAWKLAWNYFEIISEVYCSSRIFSNMFNVAEIILK